MRNMISVRKIIFIIIILTVIGIQANSKEIRIRISCKTELVVECNDDDILKEVVKLQFDHSKNDCSTKPCNNYKIEILASYPKSTQSERITIRKTINPYTGRVDNHYYRDVKRPVCECNIDIILKSGNIIIAKKKIQQKAVGSYKDTRYPCSIARIKSQIELRGILLDMLLKEIHIQNASPNLLNTYLTRIMQSRKNDVINRLKNEKYQTDTLNVEHWLKNIAVNFRDTCSFLSFIDDNSKENFDFIKKQFDYCDSFNKKEAISNIFPKLHLIKNEGLLLSYIFNKNMINTLNNNELKNLINYIIDLSEKDSLFKQNFLSNIERSDYADKIFTKPSDTFFEIDKFKYSDHVSFKFVNAIDDIINAHFICSNNKNLKKGIYRDILFKENSKDKLFFYMNDCCLNNLYIKSSIRNYSQIFTKYVNSDNYYLFKWYLNAFISDECTRGMQLKKKYPEQYYYSSVIIVNYYTYESVKLKFELAQWTYSSIFKNEGVAKHYNKHRNRLLGYIKKRFKEHG